MKQFSGIFLVILGLILGLSSFVIAQNTSNKGTDFWLAYGNHVAGYTVNIGQDMVVYITSDVSTSGVLEVGGTSIPFQVTANAITNVTVPQTAYIGNNEGKVSNKGIHITSLLPIVVYAHIYDSAVSGATLVLPTSTLGKDYYSLNYQQISNSTNSHSFFFVVATEDNTEIIITPSVDTKGGLKAGIASAPIKLNKGEIYQVFGVQTSQIGSTTQGTELTGTRIQSISTTSAPCKKIAVFSGSGKIAIGCLTTGGLAGSSDNLFQQAYPTASWGKTFITVPSKDRNYDVYRIFKSDPNAVVKLNGTTIPPASFVNNFYYEFPSQSVNAIESDKAIQVVLYAVTQGKSINCTNISGDVGDPEMIFLNPLEQTLSQITMVSTQLHMILKHFINVVIPQTGVSSFTIDGVSKASLFLPVTGKPTYAYAQIPVSAGTHNLQANVGFNAIAYGFGSAESYGYAAGANVKGLGVEIRKVTNNNQVSSVCVKEELNLSVKFNSTVSRIVWDLGDGSTPLEILNPVPVNAIAIDGLYEYVFPTKVIYTILKDYKISVTANKTSPDGCGSVEVMELQFSAVNPPSSVITAVGQTCINASTTFTDASLGNGKSIKKWFWDFGDGEVSTVQNPVKKYAASGDYIVKLMVEGETGCQSDVTTQTVHVIALPIVNFNTSLPACESKDVTFTDISSTVEGTIVKWIWNFGDGTAIEEKNVATPFTHAFLVNGTYKVILKVITDKGCESVAFEKNVLINPLPIVNFGLPESCIAEIFAQFTDSSSISDGKALSYLWNFGNPSAGALNSSTLKNPTHRYTVAGDYPVTLTVTSESGCVKSLVKTFKVIGAVPKAKFLVLNDTNLCSNQEVVFRNTSTVDFGTIGKIEWFFDYGGDLSFKLVDDNPVMGKEYRFQYPTFSAPASKQVRVRMVAYSGGVCFDDEIQTIVLKPIPVVNFVIPEICIRDSFAQFTDSTTIADGSALSYSWDFGNPISGSLNSSNLKNPTHKYTIAGTYQVSLTVTSASGCVNKLVKSFQVSGAVPKADFVVLNNTQLCSNQKVVFRNTSTVDFGTIGKIEWFFDYGGDLSFKLVDENPFPGKEYRIQYPIFSAPASKQFIVRMLAYSGGVCNDEEIQTIVLKPIPIVNFGIPESCIAEIFAQFTDSSSISDGKPLSYLWNFGNPSAGALNSSTLKNPTHRYTVAGDYPVTLSVTSETGCVNSLVKIFKVSGAVPKAKFLVLNDTELCSNREVVFRNTSTIDFGIIEKLEWFFDYGGDLSFKLVDENPVPGKEYRIQYLIFSAPASKQFRVRMVAYSGGVCTDDEIQTIILKSVPEVVFTTIPDVCQEVPPFKLTQASEKNSQAGNGVYSGNGVSASGIFSPAQAGLGKHTIKYVFTTTNGCADSLSREILVMPTPILFAGRDTIILQGGEVKLNAIASGNNLTYQWVPSLGLSRDDILDPVASPLEDITYVLTVTSDQGCVAVDAIFIKVLKAPEVPNAFTPNGDGINDLWNIKYLESYVNASVRVFSRYGSMVYYSLKGYAQPWKGQMNGSDLPMGTYYYIIDPKAKGRKVISGSVTIIR